MTENKLAENQRLIEKYKRRQRLAYALRDVGLLLAIIGLFMWSYFQRQHLRQLQVEINQLKEQSDGKSR